MNRSLNQKSECFDQHDDPLTCSSQRLITHQQQNDEYESSLATDDQRAMREMDSLLAQSMHELTNKERQRQQEILHGVDKRIAEEETLLNVALEDLDRHLSSAKQRHIYEKAKGMNPDYVNDRAFRLMFLRGNEYDPQAAADQILRFFESKHELFGPEKLDKDITMADLDEDAISCIRMGWLQLAETDRSGRQILIYFAGLPEQEPIFTARSWMRAQYFVVMRALRSEETQLRGTVSIWYAIGNFWNKASGKRCLDNFISGTVFPRRKQGIHICVDGLSQYAQYSAVVQIMDGNMRARIRVHHGSRTECQNQLATFGILPHSIPVDDDARIDCSRHIAWIRSCTIEDEVTSSVSRRASLESIINPNQNDVIFTGGKISDHVGNQRFLAIIKDSADTYHPSSDEQKREVVEEIVDKIHVSGGRFLKQTKNDPTTNWEPVPPDELRKRVMQAFRNRRRLDASKNQNTNDSTRGTLISDRPRRADVIFGRSHRNQGTELLRSLIKDNLEEYELLDRGVKMRLVVTIMQTIIDKGGRFLQPDTEPGRWFEVPHHTARERISKYFRNQRRPAKKMK